MTVFLIGTDVDHEDFSVPETDGSGVALAHDQKRNKDEIVETVKGNMREKLKREGA